MLTSASRARLVAIVVACATSNPQASAAPVVVTGTIVTFAVDLPTTGAGRSATFFVLPLDDLPHRVRVVGVECRPARRDVACGSFDEIRAGAVQWRDSSVRLVVSTSFGPLDVSGTPVASPNPTWLSCAGEGGFAGEILATKYGALTWRGRIGRETIATSDCAYVVSEGVGAVT